MGETEVNSKRSLRMLLWTADVRQGGGDNPSDEDKMGEREQPRGTKSGRYNARAGTRTRKPSLHHVISKTSTIFELA